MRPGWTLDESGPFPVWRWGAPMFDGSGPWLRVHLDHTCGNRWVRVYVAPDGRRHTRTGDCDDVALAMACAEVRLGSDLELTQPSAGDLRVTHSYDGHTWRVDGYCDSPEYTGWQLGLDHGDHPPHPTPHDAGRLAAARILLGTAG